MTAPARVGPSGTGVQRRPSGEVNAAAWAGVAVVQPTATRAPPGPSAVSGIAPLRPVPTSRPCPPAPDDLHVAGKGGAPISRRTAIGRGLHPAPIPPAPRAHAHEQVAMPRHA